MIKLEEVSKVFRTKKGEEVVALDNVSLEVKEKEFVCLVGKSGAGKTTLLRLLLLEERPTNGKIFFEGEEVTNLPPSKLPQYRRKIGAVFQDYKLLPTKTAYENLSYIMEATGFSDEEIKRDVPKVLELIGLAEKAKSFPDELSAGEKQRLSIGRAVIHRPKLILADEPTGNLDPYTTMDIISIFSKIHQMGATIIFATHNREVVNLLKKRTICLEKGKIVRDDLNGRFIL